MTSTHCEYNLNEDDYTDAVPLLIHESSNFVEKSNKKSNKSNLQSIKNEGCDKIHKCDKANSDAKRKLLYAALLSVVFMVIELTGGYLAGSLAIMSDGAHLISDSLTFIIGVIGISISSRPANPKMSFGYKRIEVFCALISIFGIWVLTFFIAKSAVQRLMSVELYEINTDLMLALSVIGIFVNIVMVAVLHGDHHNHSHQNHSHEHKRPKKTKSQVEHEINLEQIQDPPTSKSSENLNVQAAFLHVLGDLLQSVGVVVAAVIIKICPEAKMADPLITILFSIIVVCTTVKIFKKSAEILLEAVPNQVSYENILHELENLADVSSVRNLKIWSLSNDFHLLNAQITIKDLRSHENVLNEASIIAKQHGIHESCIQIEELQELNMTK